MVDLPNGPLGAATPSDSRDTPPVVERVREIQPSDEQSRPRDSASESGERRVETRREDIKTRAVERAEPEAEARTPAAPRPAELALKVNEKRLNRLSELTDLRNAASGVSTTATAVELAGKANDKVADRLAQLAKIADDTIEGENLTDETRAEITREAKAIAGEIDEIARNTKFGERPLVDGSEDSSGFGSLAPDDLGVSDFDFSDTEGTLDAARNIEKARLTVQINDEGLRDTRRALKEVISQISEDAGALRGEGRSGDAEARRFEADQLAQQIRSQPAVATLATANAAPVGVLSILVGS